MVSFKQLIEEEDKIVRSIRDTKASIDNYETLLRIEKNCLELLEDRLKKIQERISNYNKEQS